MHIFTWRKRKKVFHPNGELNWNILLPSSSAMPERKSVSSPQLSIHDINQLQCPRPESGSPYFLPTRQLRPSFSHLLTTSPATTLEESPVSSPLGETATVGCVLSTFQTDAPISGNPATVSAKRVRSDWSVWYGNSGSVRSCSSSSGQDKTPYARCSSAAESLIRESPADGAPGKKKKFSSPKRLSCPVITPIYSDESSTPPSPTYDLVPVTLSRSPGEKLGLGLSIQTQPDHDTVDYVLIRAAPNDTTVQPDDEILVVNGVDLRTLRRAECVELFKNVPQRLSMVVRRTKKTPAEVGRNAISTASPTHSFTGTMDSGGGGGPGWSGMHKGRKVRRPSEPPPPPPPLQGTEDEEGMYREEQYENIYDLPYSDQQCPSEREYHSIPDLDALTHTSSYTSSCDKHNAQQYKQSDYDSNFTFRASTPADEKVIIPDDHSHDSALTTSSGSSRSSDFSRTEINEGFRVSRSDSASQCSYDPECDEESLYCDTVLLRQAIHPPDTVMEEHSTPGGKGKENCGVEYTNRPPLRSTDTNALTPENLLLQKHKLRHIAHPSVSLNLDRAPPLPSQIMTATSPAEPPLLKDFILACDDLPESSVDAELSDSDGSGGKKVVTFAPGSPETVGGPVRTKSPAKLIDGAMYRAYLGLKGRKKEKKRDTPGDASGTTAAKIRSILKTGHSAEMEENRQSGQDASGQTGNKLINTATDADHTVQPALDTVGAAADYTAAVALHHRQIDDRGDGNAVLLLPSPLLVARLHRSPLSDVHLDITPKPTSHSSRSPLTKPASVPNVNHYAGQLDLSQLLSPVACKKNCADELPAIASHGLAHCALTNEDAPLKAECAVLAGHHSVDVLQRDSVDFFDKAWWKVSDKAVGIAEKDLPEGQTPTFPVHRSGDDGVINPPDHPSPPAQSTGEGHHHADIPPPSSDLSPVSADRPRPGFIGPKPVVPPKPKFLSRLTPANKSVNSPHGSVKTNTDNTVSPADTAMYQQSDAPYNNTAHLNGPLVLNNSHSHTPVPSIYPALHTLHTDTIQPQLLPPPPCFPHDSTAVHPLNPSPAREHAAVELLATKNHLHRATYVELLDTDHTEFLTSSMTELIDFSMDTHPPLPPPPDFALSSEMTLLDLSADFLPAFPTGPAQSDFPVYLEAMRESTDSGNYPDAGTIVSDTSQIISADDSTSLSVSTTSDTSDLEDNFSLALRRDSSSSSEQEGHPHDIEILHMNWDIGLKVMLDRKGRCVVKEISRTSPLGRLGNIRPGDYLQKINGQSLMGMGESEVSTLIRALPRGLVQMTVVSGIGEGHRRDSVETVETSERRDSLVTLDSTYSGGEETAIHSVSPNQETTRSDAILGPDPDTFYNSSTDHLASSQLIATPDMASRHSYAYSRDVHYGVTRTVQPSVQSSSIIEPVARTEVTRARSMHVNEPAEFIVKIQKEPGLDNNFQSRGLAALRQHSNSFHYDPPTEPTFDLQEEESAGSFRRNGNHANGNGHGGAVAPVPLKMEQYERKISSDKTGSVVDPYKIGRELISDDFKKKRERFLGGSFEADQTKGITKVNGVAPGASTIADRRSRFAANDTKSLQSPTAPKTSFTTQKSIEKPSPAPMDRQTSQKSFDHTPSTNGSRTMPPVINRPSVLQQPTATPPITQSNRSWGRDRNRSSSISSVESLSNNSIHSFSSSDPSRQEAVSERRVSIREKAADTSLDRGRISPAQLSRQLAKKEVSASHTALNSAGTGGKFAEALARYTAKTGHEEGGRRGSKPLIIPVANKSVMSKASLFEQKSQEGGPVAPPAPLSGSKARSVSQSSLPGSGAQREWSGGRNGKVSLQTQLEEEEIPSWRKPTKPDMVTPEPTHNEIPYTPRRSQLQEPPAEPIHRQSPTVVRTVRDSGVSSSNSSVGDSPPPPASPEHKAPSRLSVNYSGRHRGIEELEDLPHPTEDFLQPTPPPPPLPATPAPLALGAIGAQVAAVQSAPMRAAEVAKKSRSTSRERTENGVAVSKEGVIGGGGEENGQEQMVEMGRRLLGPEGKDCDVVLVTLNRPDGNSGGGVGVVLTGGADSENNQIKVNKVITHSLAHRDGRIQPGDRLLLINGQPCTNMTHRQALDVLKAPAAQVSLVLARNN
ncbi:uncharacterized protein LOC129585561 [Paramacrobiotus metropolitanus]|uniref:uncharacterized protein LOC129585561 n=1 Tax=Paramacrobiotus metropolitanus TaxID=2943436 RepID=UPI002445F846|nr:uncharacterized protein LOC129585561 [Paramacrobiotus metropolitanus]